MFDGVGVVVVIVLALVVVGGGGGASGDVALVIARVLVILDFVG